MIMMIYDYFGFMMK